MPIVATVPFTVPLAEVELVYTGNFTTVELAKPAYAPGESIRMIVEVKVTRTASWDPYWESEIKAYDAAGIELTKVRVSHFAIPFVDDVETYDVDLDLGKQPEKGLSGSLSLYAMGSPQVLVAEVQFNVPITEEDLVPKPFPWWAVGAGLGAVALGTGILLWWSR